MAHVQGPAAVVTGSTTTINITFSSSTTSGNTVVACSTCWKTGSDTHTHSVSDNKSNTYSESVSTQGTTQVKAEINYCVNITGGSTHQLTLTSSATSDLGFAINEFSGISAHDTGTGSTASSAAPATTITPGSGNKTYIAVLGIAANRTSTPSWGTERQEVESTSTSHIAVLSLEAGSGSQTPTWSISSTAQWCVSASAFTESAGTTNDTYSIVSSATGTFASASLSGQNLSVIAAAVLNAASNATISQPLSVISAAAFAGASNSTQSEYLSVSAISSLAASAIALTTASLSVTSTSLATFGAASSAAVPVSITSAASSTFSGQSSASADLTVAAAGQFSPVGSTQAAGSADFTMSAAAAFTADSKSASDQNLGVTATATFTAEAAAASVVSAAMNISATSSLVMNVAEEESSIYRDGWVEARRRKIERERERKLKQEAEIFSIIQLSLPQILRAYV